MAERKERTLREESILTHPQREAQRMGKPPRIKATFYLHPEDILAIDSLQSEEFKGTGKKPERSEIVSRAIQLLRNQTGG